MAGTVLRLGWTDPLTGTFGDHPQLGPVLDLNDGVTFTLARPEALGLEPPTRTLVTSGNIRTQGESATRAIYRHNRRATVRLILGPMGSAADLVAAIRLLAAWLNAPPAVPFAVQWQPPSATAPVYLDVVGAAHAIPSDESQWLRLQVEPVEIILVVRPGLRGDRVTLQNLLPNPGFEAPSGPAVTVFRDDFTTVDAYTVISGAAPSVAGNVMTLPAGGEVSFGSAAWGAVNTLQARFQCPASGSAIMFKLHRADGNNFLDVYISASGQYLTQVIAGAAYNAASGGVALTAGAWYWLRFTQFPTAPGAQSETQVVVIADSAGMPTGATVLTLGPAPTQDGVTALAGSPTIAAIGADCAIGGAFPEVHTLSLFGPGGWMCTSRRGTASGVCSGVWEQETARTYDGGPVGSFGAARLDLPPAGTVDACWQLTTGGSQVANGVPVRQAGDSMGLSVWARSSGLAASAVISLSADEYDAAGNLVRSGLVASATGNQAAWVALSGTYVTGAGCAYLDLRLGAADGTAGSAGGTVWFDNVQCWNVTSTGQAAMPYAELRFPQSPAQLLLSGLAGDLPAPAFLAIGTYLTNWPTGSTLEFAFGTRAHATRTARMAAPSVGFYGSALSPTATAALDSGSYGGYFVQANVTNGWNPRAFSFAPADAPGVYHLLGRFLTQQAQGNLASVQVRAVTQQRLQPWYGALDSSDVVGTYYGPLAHPVTESGTWLVADAGQVNVPPFAQGPLTDPAQTYLTPRCQWGDLTSGGSLCRHGWQMLLPVDGSLLAGTAQNAANAPYGVTNRWFWCYSDGLGERAAWSFSVEAAPLPAPAHASGGPGTQGTGAISVNPAADARLILDPGQQINGVSINQCAAYMTDGAGGVLPLHAEITYTPLYLYPR